MGFASGERLGEFSVVSCCAVSSLVSYGAREVYLLDFEFPGLDRSDR
jgi:hypothetical protein